MYQANPHSTEQKVEWAYAFDVHCNGFLVIFLLTYLLQFCFLALLNRDNWVSLFLGNTIYFAAYSYYFYLSFLGYRGDIHVLECQSTNPNPPLALPFLHRTEVFLGGILIVTGVYFVGFFGFNISHYVSSVYFGH
jgi:hypothetical protein